MFIPVSTVIDMKIAVLSGKGGTGKTFISVNLAHVAGKSVYVDCDVEEPNGHLFLKPKSEKTTVVSVPIPQIDAKECVGCRRCVNFCKFNALAFVLDRPRLFPEICHSCGGCKILCEFGAITEVDKRIGEITIGKSGKTQVIRGTLDVGEISGVPIINKMMEMIPKSNLTVIDCPPGCGCGVMESIRDADYCVLVSEPTIFGAHNLEMVYDLVKETGKPFGAVLNKCTDSINPSEEFCVKNGVKILTKIPFDRSLALNNSNGELITDTNPESKVYFKEILNAIKEEMK